MKKLILFAAILFAGVSVVNAQQVKTSTDSKDVNLKVTLNPIQQLTVVGNNVNLIYSTPTHYESGADDVTKTGHLKVYSTQGFTVSVKSEHDDIPGTDDNYKISSAKISIDAPVDDNTATGFEYISAVSLSTTEKNLFKSTTGGIDKTYNIVYKGAALNENLDKLFNGVNASVYETTVTYTIVAN